MAKRLSLAVLAAFALAAPAHAQERQWTLDASEQDAYLVFGVPESDDVGISIWCPIESGEVRIYVPEASAEAEADKDVTAILSTEDTTREFKARSEVNADAGVTAIEVDLPVDDPILAAMLKADRLRVKVGQDEMVFPLFDADLSGLMELCRKPQ